ncbi:MAG: carbohydrate ABC transporter permease, partial [Thermomicrobiales bacterium]|nr:carbohydrate ABC transporter permease [Thermomicrobiales bacterium]
MSATDLTEAPSRTRANAARTARPSGPATAHTALTYVILAILTAIALGPFVIIALAALKDNAELAGNTFGLPQAWRWDHFADAWNTARFSRYFRSSVFVAAPVVVISSLLSVLAGYAFGRMRFPGANVLFFLLLLGIMIPGEAVIIPLYHNLQAMGLYDTYWAIILPQIGFNISFGALWMRGFFSQVPNDLPDAATVDGANSWGVLWDVLLPLARPAILTMAVLFFLWSWNDFLLPLV